MTPFFEVDIELEAPQVVLHPSLDEIQVCINRSAQAILRYLYSPFDLLSVHLPGWLSIGIIPPVTHRVTHLSANKSVGVGLGLGIGLGPRLTLCRYGSFLSANLSVCHPILFMS